MDGERVKYRYDHYTWPEIKELIPKQPVCIISIGSVEDHGHHLPLDVDNYLIGHMVDAVAQRIPDEVLLLPHVPYGFEDHHMSFPGTITIQSQHLEAFMLDITLSLAHHGFKKILIADGHGSNMPILDLVCRKTIIQSDALCAAFIWPGLITKTLKETRVSEYPGGTESYAAPPLETRRAALAVDDAHLQVHLPPATQITLSLSMARFVREAAYAMPW